MYQIAICDDKIAALDKIKNCLERWQEKHPDCDLDENFFTSADKMLERMRNHGYKPDLLLLDVYMPEKTGITVAKEFRRLGNEGAIVFITTSREHALEAFGVDAVQYLIKPVDEQALFRVLDSLFQNMQEKRRDSVLLRIDGRICRINVDDIVYCEAQGKNQRLHLLDGQRQQLRMTMTEIHEMLSPWQEFTRVGVSYIVNLNHVDSLNAQEICLDSEESIFLPRGAYQPLRERYFKYYCEEQ